MLRARIFSFFKLRLGLVLLAAFFCAEARADGAPFEWQSWFELVRKNQEPLTAEQVIASPEARAMDSWLATAGVFKLRAFEKEMRDALFVERIRDTFDSDISQLRWNTARALFALSSSLRLESLARRYLFGSPLRDTLNPYAEQKLQSQALFSIFMPFSHWRRAKFWNSVVAEIMSLTPRELDGYSEIHVDKSLSREERVSLWKISFLSREWKTASADDIVPLLEELVETKFDDHLVDFLTEQVLPRKDLMARGEWKYWVWSLIEPELQYAAVSPGIRARIQKILRLLQLPGAEAHIAILEWLLDRKDTSLDPFIEKELLGNPPFKGHPLLVKLARSPTPTVSRLRYAFATGESLHLWSASIGRYCQAHLRRVVLRGARRFGVHPVQLLKTFGRPPSH